MSQNIRVGITHGDVNGIGYEIILKALGHESMTELCTPVIFGYRELAERAKTFCESEDIKFHSIDKVKDAQTGKLNILELKGKLPELNPGNPTEASGKSAVESLEKAVTALKAGEIDVLVTAPISKMAVQDENFNFPGHTEYLEDRLGEGNNALMILCDDSLRVALVSTHVAVSEIASQVTEEKLEGTIRRLEKSLIEDFTIGRPRIAVLSLNPHCGDGGLLGKEEGEVIVPVIEKLRGEGKLVFGPYASDGFFGSGDYKAFDGVVAMYHDQGLGPFKTIAGSRGVNFTAGLPFVRTSPDHGTAFDIAWKGKADETSMREAIYKAIDIYRSRQNYKEISANPLKLYVPEKHERPERHEKGFNKGDAKSESVKFEEE